MPGQASPVDPNDLPPGATPDPTYEGDWVRQAANPQFDPSFETKPNVLMPPVLFRGPGGTGAGQNDQISPEDLPPGAVPDTGQAPQRTALPPQKPAPGTSDFMKDVYSAGASGNAMYQHLMGNSMMLIDKTVDTLSETLGIPKTQIFKHWQDIFEQKRKQSEATAEEYAKGREQDFSSNLHRGVLGGAITAAPWMAGAATGAALGSVVPGVGTVAGGVLGGILGQAGVSALSEADKGPAAAGQAALFGAVQGGLMEVMGPAGRWIKVPVMVALQAYELMKQGVPWSTALANSLGSSAIMLTHPGQMGTGETLSTMGRNIPEVPKNIVGALPEAVQQRIPARVPLLPPVMPPRLTPQQQASVDYMKSLGLNPPLSMQSGSEATGILEGALRASIGGGPATRGQEALRQGVLGAVPELAGRISKEPATSGEAGEALRSKLAGDLETTRSELAGQVAPEATTPEQAGSKVIEAGKARIKALDQAADTAYKAAWEAEKDPRNIQKVPVRDKDGGIIYDEDGKPTTEKMALPIDMTEVQDALVPLAERYAYTLSETDARASLGLKVMRSIINGSPMKPASAAELDLSMLKQAARTEKGMAELRDPSQGLAAASVARLQAAIDQTMSKAAYPGWDPASGEPSPALRNLQEGRRATAQKYDVADTFATLGRRNIEDLEPVGVHRALTWSGDAGIGRLRDIAKIAPETMPDVGRAFIEGGGNWKSLGPETKKILFKDPELIKNLDDYYAKYEKFGPLTKLEPEALFDRLTQRGGLRDKELEAVATEAPELMPRMGRAYFEGLLNRVTREGDIQKIQGTLDSWLDMSDASKAALIKDPETRRDVTNLLFSLKQIAREPNPSGTAKMRDIQMWKHMIFAGAAGMVGGKAVGPEAGIGGGALAGLAAEVPVNMLLGKLLYNPRFTRMLTRGFQLELKGEKAGADLAARTATKIAGEEPPEGPPPPAGPASSGGGPSAGAGGPSPRAQGASSSFLRDVLDDPEGVANRAFERIRERGINSSMALGPGSPHFNDLVEWMGAKIVGGAKNVGEVTEEALNRFGKRIRPELQNLWNTAVPMANRAMQDVKRRDLEDLALRIPQDDRMVSKDPSRTLDGKKFHLLDLDKPGPGYLPLKKLGAEKAEQHNQTMWDEAVKESEAAGGSTAAGVVKQTGARPPDVNFLDDSLKQPDRSRYWYELSAESFTGKHFDVPKKDQPKLIDTVAATSGGAKPTDNMRRAVGVLSEDQQRVPSLTDLKDPVSARRALDPGTGAIKTRKYGSFSGTMQLIAGLTKRRPLPVNDVQVASMFGITGDQIAKNPILYEVISRYLLKVRDAQNAELNPSGKWTKDSPQPYESWQIQAPMWTFERQRKEPDSQYDDYSQVMDRDILPRLQAAGIPTPGGKITMETLKDPRTRDVMSPTAPRFLRTPVTTVETATRLTPAGAGARTLYEKLLGMDPTIPWVRDAKDKYQRHQRAAMEDIGERYVTIDRDTKEKVKNPSLISQLMSAMTGRDMDVSRIDTTGYGTYDGEVNPNMRIPLAGNTSRGWRALDEIEQNAFLSYLGKALRQDGMGRSLFKTVEHGKGDTFSVLLRRYDDKVDQAGVEKFGRAIGLPINVTQTPTGVALDIVLPEGSPSPTRQQVEDALAATWGNDPNVHTWRTYSRNYDGKYIHNSEYDTHIGAYEQRNEQQKRAAKTASKSSDRGTGGLGEGDRTAFGKPGDIRRVGRWIETAAEGLDQNFSKWQQDTQGKLDRHLAREAKAAAKAAPP